MSVAATLAPVFVQVALVFALMFRMGGERLAALKAGETRLDRIALGQPQWPDRAIQAANAFNNQFQLPLLYGVLVALLMVTRMTDFVFVVMGWVFVLLRVGHAAVHVTSNDVPLRFRLYLAGALVLMAMWALFAVRVLLGL